jgi:anti-sigma regulatory factor (Ser/Thr protein kinase)
MMEHTTAEIRNFLIHQIPKQPEDVARLAAEKFRISRQAVNRHLRRLADEGIVIASGRTRGRKYSLATTSTSETFSLQDALEEHVVWRSFVRPTLGEVGRAAEDICHYGFTEMFNNAIEHSGGMSVRVNLGVSAAAVELQVTDDGIGIFRKIRQELDLEDELHSVLELAKGKLTTDPQRHTGEGIFFASRMFDEFVIRSGTLSFMHLPNGGETDWLVEQTSHCQGTAVEMKIDPQTERRVERIFDEFTSGEEGDYAFDVTHVPVALARHGDENLVSRSQARRLVRRFEGFRRVVLNFKGVGVIGQAFADEIFRVFRSEHPEVELLSANTNSQVERMIRRARSRAAEDEQAGPNWE